MWLMSALIALPQLLVAVVIGVTAAPSLSTWAVRPFAVIAIAAGNKTTLIGIPGLSVAVALSVSCLKDARARPHAAEPTVHRASPQQGHSVSNVAIA